MSTCRRSRHRHHADLRRRAAEPRVQRRPAGRWLHRRAAGRVQQRLHRFRRRPSAARRPSTSWHRRSTSSASTSAPPTRAPTIRSPAGGTGATARTYFDSTFGGNGIRRLLVCNNTTALQVAAAQVPEFTVALVVVNSTIYGGSGGSVGTYSLANGATEIAHPRDGSHRVRARRRVPVLRRRQRDRPRSPYRAASRREPNVTANTNRNTLKWRWAVASATAIPTMSNPNCGAGRQPRRAPCRRAPSACSRARTTTTAARYRPEYDCKMRNLGVPFCHVCRQVIWNRIGPLAALPARAKTPIHVVARYPEHLDVFAVGVRRADDEQLVGRRERLGGVVPGLRRRRVAGRPRLPDHRRRALLRPPRPLHGRHRQPRLQRVVGRLERVVGLVPPRDSRLPAGLHRQCRLPLHRPPRRVHDRRPTAA